MSSHQGNSRSRAINRNQGVKEFSQTSVLQSLAGSLRDSLGSENIVSSSALETYRASLTSFGFISRVTSIAQKRI